MKNKIKLLQICLKYNYFTAEVTSTFYTVKLYYNYVINIFFMAFEEALILLNTLYRGYILMLFITCIKTKSSQTQTVWFIFVGILNEP